MRNTIPYIFISIAFIITRCNTHKESNKSDSFYHIDSIVHQELSEKKIPSIAIGIVKNGTAVFSKAYGYADIEKKIPADEYTIYQMGSVTRIFTGHLLTNFGEGQIIGEVFSKIEESAVKQYLDRK